MKGTYDSLAVARRIRAAGRPVFIAEDDEPSYVPSDGLVVRQTGGAMESRAINCSGGTAFVIYLVIINKVPRLAISRFGLELPWQQDYFYWLEDPLVIDRGWRCYRVPGDEGLEFNRHEVLNHQADVTRMLSQGESLKGFLLGYGFEAIPESFRYGAKFPAFVIVYDQHGREHRSGVELEVVRRPTRPRSGPRRSLLDYPDRMDMKAPQARACSLRRP
jgi:hypothetical protein